MDFWDVLKGRHSVRSFLDKPVGDKDIEKIVAAASSAPSAGDQKCWRFIAVKGAGHRREMQQAVVDKIVAIAKKIGSPRARREFLNYSRYFTFFAEAPCVIAAVMKPYDSLTGRILSRVEGDSTYVSTAGLQSVSAAFQNMLLAAFSLGLGTCWMTGPMVARAELEKILKINLPEKLVALTPLGCPKAKLKPHKLTKNLTSILDII